MEEVKHYQINGKFWMVIERAASTKGVDGFKVEANGDDMVEVYDNICSLYNKAMELTKVTVNNG